jgi:hypothetical protein
MDRTQRVSLRVDKVEIDPKPRSTCHHRRPTDDFKRKLLGLDGIEC